MGSLYSDNSEGRLTGGQKTFKKSVLGNFIKDMTGVKHEFETVRDLSLQRSIRFRH